MVKLDGPMKLYQVTCETDAAIVGAYPQVYFYSIEGLERPYDNQWGTTAEPGFVMSGEMEREAKRTSLLSCTEISPGRGLLLDDALLSCLIPTLPNSCRRHRFEVRQAVEGAVHENYTFLEVGMTSELLDFIDYERSSFRRTLFGDFHSEVHVDSFPDWEAKQREENDRRSSLAIEPRTLCVRGGCFERVGIFKLPFSATIYLPEVTARLIAEQPVTGIRLREEREMSIA